MKHNEKRNKRPDEVLMRANEVAEFLKVHHCTIYKWVDEGRIGYVDLGGPKGRRCLRFSTSHIEKFVEDRSHDV